MQTEQGLPSSVHVGRVALRVGDLAGPLSFYGDVIGLSVLDRDGSTATLGVGETPLLVLVASPDVAARSADEAGLFHVAFRMPDRAALGRALGRVRDRWELDGASDHHVSEALYLRDPEGNGVEVYRDRPRSAWPTDGGRVAMATLPLDLDDLAAATDDASDGPSDGSAPDRAPAGTTIGHVHLEVSSIQRARAFYVDALGLNVRQEWGDDALFVAAGDYHHHVGLNTWNGRSAAASGRGLWWFELVLPDAETLDGARRRLADAGVTTTETGEGTEIVDPDGIRIRLRTDA